MEISILNLFNYYPGKDLFKFNLPIFLYKIIDILDKYFLFKLFLSLSKKFLKNNRNYVF